MATDFEAEGLLEGLEGPARSARLELLERLESEGVDPDELRAASAEGRLALVPVERILVGDSDRYTAAQVAERTGVDERPAGALLARDRHEHGRPGRRRVPGRRRGGRRAPGAVAGGRPERRRDHRDGARDELRHEHPGRDDRRHIRRQLPARGRRRGQPGPALRRGCRGAAAAARPGARARPDGPEPQQPAPGVRDRLVAERGAAARLAGRGGRVRRPGRLHEAGRERGSRPARRRGHPAGGADARRGPSDPCGW